MGVLKVQAKELAQVLQVKTWCLRQEDFSQLDSVQGWRLKV